MTSLHTPRWVELEGEVVPVAELVAPLSGARCVLYDVSLALGQRLRDGLAGHRREVAGARFLMHGAEGPVLVEMSRASVRLRRGAVRRLRLGDEPAADERVRALYERLGRTLPRRRLVAGRERRLVAGDRVRVVGLLEDVPDARGLPGGYRSPPLQPFLEAVEVRAL